MVWPPNKEGTSQFHRYITTKPKIAMARIAIGAIKAFLRYHLFLIVYSSRRLEFLVNSLEPLPQMEHRIALAREQCVDAYSGIRGDLLETASVHFMPDKHRALLFGQLFERGLQFVQQDAAGVDSFRAVIGRRQQIFESHAFVGALRHFAEELRLFLAEAVDDAVACHAIQPRARLFHRLHHSI